MKPSSSPWLYVWILVLLPSASLGETERVAIPALSEPWNATRQHMIVAGMCGKQNITVLATSPHDDAGPTVTIKLNGTEAHFDSRAPYVREMFGTTVALQYSLICAGSGFEMIGWGTSFADIRIPAFVYGEVIFDRQGRVDQYSGMTVASYERVRLHLQ